MKQSDRQLIASINKASTLQEALSYHRSHPSPTFHAELASLMKNTSSRNIYTSAKMSKSYFYRILDGSMNPGRDMTLRIGIAMRLPLNEMNELLLLAGFAPLYPKNIRDAVLIYGISKKYPWKKLMK